MAFRNRTRFWHLERFEVQFKQSNIGKLSDLGLRAHTGFILVDQPFERLGWLIWLNEEEFNICICVLTTTYLLQLLLSILSAPYQIHRYATSPPTHHNLISIHTSINRNRKRRNYIETENRHSNIFKENRIHPSTPAPTPDPTLHPIQAFELQPRAIPERSMKQGKRRQDE
jgi:hypothetical protein